MATPRRSLPSRGFSDCERPAFSNQIALVGNGVNVDGFGSMTMAGEGSLEYQGKASLAASGNNPLATVLGGMAGATFAHGKMTFLSVVGVGNLKDLLLPRPILRNIVDKHILVEIPRDD